MIVAEDRHGFTGRDGCEISLFSLTFQHWTQSRCMYASRCPGHERGLVGVSERLLLP